MDALKTWLLINDRTISTTQKIISNLSLMYKRVGGYTAVHFSKYIPQLLESNCSAKYVNTILDSLRVYHHFLEASKDPNFDKEVFNIKYLKEKPTLKSILSDEEIEAFLSLPKPRNVNPLHWSRWNLFYEILSLTGLRTGELAKMQVGQVNFGLSCFEVLDDKTHHNRLVPIPPHLIKRLQDYVETCDKYLFPSLRGGISQGCWVDNVDWHYNFHTRLKRLGIKRQGLSPYSLRHTFITRMLEEDVNIFKVQKIVGHRRLETTAGYTHLTTKDMQKAILKLPRIAKNTSPEVTLAALKEAVHQLGIETNPRFEYSFIESVNGLKMEVKIITIGQEPKRV